VVSAGRQESVHQNRPVGQGTPSRTEIAFGTLYWAISLTLVAVLGTWLWPNEGLLARLSMDEGDGRQAPSNRTEIDPSLGADLLWRRPYSQLSRYAVEWTGYLLIDEATHREFALATTGAARLEIDGQLIVENPGGPRMPRQVGAADLDPGLHCLYLRYVHKSSPGGLTLLWAGTGNFAFIPATQLIPGEVWPAARRWRLLLPLAGMASLFVAAGLLFAPIRSQFRRARAAPSPLLESLLVALERPAVGLAVVLITGAAMRVLIWWCSPAILWPDSQVFYVTMRNIERGAWFAHDAYRTFLYPVLLTAVLGGRSPQSGSNLVAVQQALGLVAAAFFYDVARRVFTPLVALAGAVAFVLHPLQWFYELSVLSETLFTTVLALTLWVALRACDRRTELAGACLGLSLAALVLVRPVAQWFIVCPVAALIGCRPRPTVVAAVLVGFILPVGLWMSVNENHYGFAGVALGRGLGLYIRVFDVDLMIPPPDATDSSLRDLWVATRRRGQGPNSVRDTLNYDRGYSAAMADDAMYAFAKETAMRQPVRFALGTLVQWSRQIVSPAASVRTCNSPVGDYLCSGRSLGESLPGILNTPVARSVVRPFLIRYVLSSGVKMSAVALLACAGVLLGAGRGGHRGGIVLLAGAVAYFTLVPALSQYALDRYRLPIDELLFLWAAWAVRSVAVLSMARRSQWTGGRGADSIEAGTVPSPAG